MMLRRRFPSCIAPAIVLIGTLLAAACAAHPTETTEAPRTALLGADAGAAASVPVTPETETSVPARAAPPPSATPQPPSPTPGPPAPARVHEGAPPAILARAAVVVDGASGAVLYDNDAHTPLPPASTTKVLTALLAIERGRLDEEIEVKLDDRTYWGSVMGLQNGDRFTLQDLLYGLMLPSGNDAAYVIAAHIAGSERAFADLMNERMRQLGLTENHFLNASGLGRETANLISAHDLALLARYAMTNPVFANLVKTRSWTARGSRVLAMRNGNELLYTYPGADGVKIGWGGRSAGQTVVGTAVRNGHRLFVVLLNTPDRPGESAALLTWAFANHEWTEADGGR